MRTDELDFCPSCGFSKDEHSDHLKACPKDAGPWERYAPAIYSDRFLGKWVIECQNCGMEVIFAADDDKEAAGLWNNLPRRNPTTPPKGEER